MNNLHPGFATKHSGKSSGILKKNSFEAEYCSSASVLQTRSKSFPNRHLNGD